MTGGYHPWDAYSWSAGRTTNSARLTMNFEDAVRLGQGDVELVAAVAIARVARLEMQLAQLRDDECPPTNVVPIRKEAPTRLSPLGA